MSEQNFQSLSLDELSKILGLTIKRDEENKIVTFLCMLSAFTDNAQFNISFNAPSSSGKSFIPLEVASLFPAADVMRLGNASPKSFFHEEGKYDKETNTITVDLERKIIIFLDQPKMHLLESLRSLLSHDQKQMQSKITDKNNRGGNRTKTVVIKGYPSVIFCSAGLNIDEQEATRFFLLSPEINQEKIRESIVQKIKRESNHLKFKAWLEELPERKLLQERIKMIKQAHIDEINITSSQEVEDRFFSQRKMVKPRHSRDVSRLMSLIKALALLNFWWRQKEGSTITANQQDIDDAFKIWDKLSVTQELSLPPYIYSLFLEVIIPLWDSKVASGASNQKEGIGRQEIIQKHYEVYGRMLDNEQLRQQILPMLETSGLIYQEPHATDKRKVLVYPIVPTFISPDAQKDANNNGEQGGLISESEVGEGVINNGSDGDSEVTNNNDSRQGLNQTDSAASVS